MIIVKFAKAEIVNTEPIMPKFRLTFRISKDGWEKDISIQKAGMDIMDARLVARALYEMADALDKGDFE